MSTAELEGWLKMMLVLCVAATGFALACAVLL